MQSAEYRNWSRSSQSTLVWSGVPGAGKTIIAALVIKEHLLAARSPQKPFVFIYYNYKRQSQQTFRHTLETILHQIVDGFLQVPESMERLFNTIPSSKEIKTAIQELLEACERLTIVTDALDECHDETRIELFSWIMDLQAVLPIR